METLWLMERAVPHKASISVNTQSTSLTALCLPAGPRHFAGLCLPVAGEMLSSELDGAVADMNSRQLWL